MVSLPEELQAREAAARQRVGELQAEAEELALKLEKAQEDLSRLEITRETVTELLAELSAAEDTAQVDASAEKVSANEEAAVSHGVGVIMVPPWREGLATVVLPYSLTRPRPPPRRAHSSTGRAPVRVGRPKIHASTRGAAPPQGASV